MSSKSVLTIVLFFLFHQTMAQENLFISNGNEFFRKGMFDQAEAQYRRALESNPGNQTARANLANALYKQKKYKDAVTAYNQVAASSEGKMKAAAYYNAGVAHTRQNELEACIEAFKNALRITPEDKHARENLQKALLELKKQKSQSDQQKKQNPSSMSQSEAEKRLKQLEDKEKMLREKMKEKQPGGGRGKDW